MIGVALERRHRASRQGLRTVVYPSSKHGVERCFERRISLLRVHQQLPDYFSYVAVTST